MASIYPTYPPELTNAQSEYLITALKDWSIANGLAVRPAPAFVSKDVDPSGVLAVTAPVTLFPSPFPRACFEEAKAIQTAYNELYSAIARDEEWLREIVEELIEVDDFIAKLWEVHLAVKKEGYVQDLTLGLFRSDYMVHVDPNNPSKSLGIKQVEFNTIASSFGGLASKVSQLHRHLLSSSAYPTDGPFPIDATFLPTNHSITSLAKGLAAAHHAYGTPKSTPGLPGCVLILVQPVERNVFDQRALEYELQNTHHIPIFRLSFDAILEHTHIPTPDPARPLIYTPPHSPSTKFEVTTLYFRAGYSPDEYDSASWKARLHLERSAAIKCPSVLTHLAGSKKVQQVLATPSSPYLERFLSDQAVVERVRKTFMPIYPLDDSTAGQDAVKTAHDEQQALKYVLKPQREGGGNNIYRSKIPGFLRSLGPKKWKGYILMELIEPPALENAIFREGKVLQGGVIGELGVYGACLWRNGRESGKDEVSKDKGEVIQNWEAGYLLRTKGSQSEEGGVAAGFGCVDSCLLLDI